MVLEALVTRESPRPRLTDRETECVRLLSAGLTPKAIAHRLGVSYWTVLSHLANARRRMGAETNVQLALRASRKSRDEAS